MQICFHDFPGQLEERLVSQECMGCCERRMRDRSVSQEKGQPFGQGQGNTPGDKSKRLPLAILLPLQSTVSESTLIALLAARKDKILAMKASEPGADESSLNARLIAYASDQVSCPVQAKPWGQGLASGIFVLE